MPNYGRWLPGSAAFGDGRTTVTRWLVLDISMPLVLRPLRRAITRSFERENVRTMAALKTYAGASSDPAEAIG